MTELCLHCFHWAVYARVVWYNPCLATTGFGHRSEKVHMESSSNSPTKTTEQRLLEVVRRLPPDRVAQVLDFAEFLASKRKPQNGSDVLDTEARTAKATTGDARWDALLASDESQRLLERMADEVEARIETRMTGNPRNA